MMIDGCQQAQELSMVGVFGHCRPSTPKRRWDSIRILKTWEEFNVFKTAYFIETRKFDTSNKREIDWFAMFLAVESIGS